MSFKLAIYNPSEYQRKGQITVPLQEIPEPMRLSPENWVLRDEWGNQLPYQIDRIDPQDPCRDTLSFAVQEWISSGPTNYSSASTFVTVEQGVPEMRFGNEPCLEILWGPDGNARGFRLSNRRLIVWFNLIPDLENNGQDWYAGSATSVQLDRQEILDHFMIDCTSHDPEKRCMQVEQVELWNMSDRHPTRIKLFNQPYELICHSIGPIRATVTIASKPFNCNYPDPKENKPKPRQLRCRLYRVISLYIGAEYVIEEMFIKAESINETTAKEVINPFFAVSYYAHINFRPQQDLADEERIGRFYVPSCSAVGSPRPPYPGYGLATDIPHADPIRWGQHRFKWQLGTSQSVKCLHLFMHGPSGGHYDWTGSYWDKYIYRTPIAKFHEEGQAMQTEQDASKLSLA